MSDKPWVDLHTPIADFSEVYPLTFFPTDQADLSKENLDVIFKDSYNRLQYLKEASTTQAQNVTNVSAIVGKDVTNNTLPSYGSTNVVANTQALVTAIGALDTNAGAVAAKLSNIGAGVGGGVLEGTLGNYSDTSIISNGDSHHVALGKLSEATSEAISSAEAAASQSTENGTLITNVANKVGAGASSSSAFVFSSKQLITDGDTLKVIAEKFDKYVASSRRQNEYNVRTNMQNWADINSLSGAYFYESFIDSTKINSGQSVGTLDTLSQMFYNSGGTWTYISTIVSVPSTTNEVKIKYFSEGAISVFANLQGSPSVGFISIPSQDTFVSIPAGASLVIKITGSSSSKIFNLGLLYRTV